MKVNIRLLSWGSNIKKVIKIKKKTIQVVTSKQYFAHTELLNGNTKYV